MINTTASASMLKIVSSNVRGFNDKAKRDELLHHLNRDNPDIICLCDTRLKDEYIDMLRNETNMLCQASCNNQVTGRGVCILTKKNIPISTNLLHTDQEGNLIIVACKYDDHEFILANIYGPNEDDPEFFERLFERLSNLHSPNVLIIGDFNVTINPLIDNLNYRQRRNEQARHKLIEMMESYGYNDTYRHIYGDKKMYTWYNPSGPQRSRLDMCLATNAILPFIVHTKAQVAFKSDHRPILISIDFTNFERGPGYWKMNDSLLSDMDYVDRIKKCVKNTCAKYVSHPVYNNFYQDASPLEISIFSNNTPESLQDLEYTINPHLIYEMLLNDIRCETISYSVRKKKMLTEMEKRLHNKLSVLQDRKSAGIQSESLENDLIEAENRYTAFMDDKVKKNSFTKQIQHKIEGEKPTAYFCALEKNMSAQKYISRLKVKENNNEVTITDQKRISKEVHKFYKLLYENKDNIEDHFEIEDFLRGGEHDNVFLSEVDAEALEGHITKNELLAVLKKTKNKSSPGSNGFTYGFFKFFWRDLGGFMLKAINFSYDIKNLPASQRIGIISLLPKGNKPRDQLKNLRPVTLLNTDYKLTSGCIAHRLNEVLPKIINNQQTGFVKGRFIGENIRNTFDLLELAKIKRVTGLLLLIDFEKAFDSLSFACMIKVLKYFKCKPGIIHWVETLLYDFKACINLAGNLTEFFNVSRGARQGDPLASVLFVMAIEILAIKFRNCEEVHPFKIDGLTAILSMFADDMSIFLRYDAANLRIAIGIMNNFFRLSGLKMQLEKTQAIVFGEIPQDNYKLCEDINLKWSQSFSLLGIEFTATLDGMEVNLDSKHTLIDNIINNWKYRFITPLGRAIIAKTLLLSKLSYIALVLPCLNKQRIKQLEDKIYYFVWAGNDKTARGDAKLKEKDGGLNFPDILASWQGFKIAWFKRLFATNSLWGEMFDKCLSQAVPGLTRHDLLSRIGTFDLLDLGRRFPLTFWRESFSVLKIFLEYFVKKYPKYLLVCNLWNSHLFLRNKLPCKYNSYGSLYRKIEFPIDIMKYENNTWSFISHLECENRYGQVNIEQFISLKVVIQQSFQKHNFYPTEHINFPYQSILSHVCHLSDKGCGRWVKVLKNNKITNKSIIERETKWEQSLGRLQGPAFWDDCYQKVYDIFFNNKLKLFYYQIVRGNLKTNRILQHIPTANTTEHCTFCQTECETILHLFFDCGVVAAFYHSLFPLLTTEYPVFGLDNIQRKEFIFGVRHEKIYSARNFILLLLKRFIWIVRCKKERPQANNFLLWLEWELKIMKAAYREDLRLSFLALI